MTTAKTKTIHHGRSRIMLSIIGHRQTYLYCCLCVPTDLRRGEVSKGPAPFKGANSLLGDDSGSRTAYLTWALAHPLMSRG